MTYGYDAASQRTAMTDATGATVYGYDDDGDLLTKTLTPASGPVQSWAYTYDANGNPLTRTRPDTSVETWTFDVADQPTKVVAPTGTTTFTFDDAGNQLLTTSPNGTTETRVWDRNGYLTSITSKKGTSVLTSQTVTRDSANQPTKTVLVRSGTTENRSYLYDTNERITAVCYAATCTAATATQQWTYDKDGNRLTEINGVSSPVTTTWTYDTSDRILTQKIGTAAATVPTYDPDGNLTTDNAGRTWTYRLDGLQTTSTAAGATTTFGYDGDGHRTSAAITAGTGTGATTAYTWDTNTPLAMLAGISRDPDGTGPTAPSVTAIRYDTAGTGTALTQTVDGTTSWYAHDPLGSVTDLVSSTGAITRAQDWTPYGATRTAAGAPGTPTGPAFALGWTGALPDADGTWHLRARQYDPTTGTFTARDPSATPDPPARTTGTAPPMATRPDGPCCSWTQAVDALDLSRSAISRPELSTRGPRARRNDCRSPPTPRASSLDSGRTCLARLRLRAGGPLPSRLWTRCTRSSKAASGCMTPSRAGAPTKPVATPMRPATGSSTQQPWPTEAQRASRQGSPLAPPPPASMLPQTL